VYKLFTGHVIKVLKSLPDNSVDVIFTSPPYRGVRSYAGEQKVLWGGEEDCVHDWREVDSGLLHENRNGTRGKQVEVAGPLVMVQDAAKIPALVCNKCNGMLCALGLEPTHEEYVAHLVMCFAEAKRVLKDTGVCFVNLGDSYAGSGKGPSGHNGIGNQEERQGFASSPIDTADLPSLNLIGIPWAFAFAMRDAGWLLRSDIVWAKGTSGQRNNWWLLAAN
jgi:DNA modification methylase